MLVARVELWEGGDPNRSTVIGCTAIANATPLTPPVSDYLVVRVDHRGWIRDGIVHGHRRDDGFWPLLSRATSDGLSEDLPAGTLTALVAMSERMDFARMRPAASPEGTSS